AWATALAWELSRVALFRRAPGRRLLPPAGVASRPGPRPACRGFRAGHLDGQQRNFVMPRGVRAPPLDLLQQAVEALREGGVARLAQPARAPPRTEVLPVRVPRLGHPVGVQQQPVSRSQRDRLLRITALPDADREPGHFEQGGWRAPWQVDGPG